MTTAFVTVPAGPDTSTIVSFFVQGLAIPQPRPKATTVNGFARVYEAGHKHKIHDWKASLRADAIRAMAGRKPVPHLALRLELVFRMPRPKSLTIPKWAARALLVPSGKDIDNLSKSVMDVFNRIVWDDDRQVTTLFARKEYVLPHQLPGVRIGVFIDSAEGLA